MSATEERWTVEDARDYVEIVAKNVHQEKAHPKRGPLKKPYYVGEGRTEMVFGGNFVYLGTVNTDWYPSGIDFYAHPDGFIWCVADEREGEPHQWEGMARVEDLKTKKDSIFSVGALAYAIAVAEGVLPPTIAI